MVPFDDVIMTGAIVWTSKVTRKDLGKITPYLPILNKHNQWEIGEQYNTYKSWMVFFHSSTYTCDIQGNMT